MCCSRLFKYSALKLLPYPDTKLIGNGHADYDVISHMILKRHVLQRLLACEIIVPYGCVNMFISYRVPHPIKVV